MFGRFYTHWIAGAALMLALATNLVGVGNASAQTLTTTSSVSISSTAQLAIDGATTAAAGTVLTVRGSSYEADEPVGFWINAPAGTTVSLYSLGQTDSQVVDGVIGLDAMASADDNGAFTYTLNTSGLADGNYSLVAHGLNSGIEQVFSFTIN